MLVGSENSCSERTWIVNIELQLRSGECGKQADCCKNKVRRSHGGSPGVSLERQVLGIRHAWINECA